MYGISSAPPPLPYENDDKYPLGEDYPSGAASSKQQKVTGNYVQCTVANADNKVCDSLPKMDNSRDFCCHSRDLKRVKMEESSAELAREEERRALKQEG